MIIIYGGAFDPPHRGHVQSVTAVAAKFPQARIFVIPGLQPAGASGAHKHPSAGYAHRLAMCEIAFATKHHPQVTISTIESDIAPPNYTITTLEKIKVLYPDEPLHLMLGQDQIMKFPFWHRPLDILRLCSLIVVKRSGRLTEARELSQDAEKAAFMLDLKLRWTKTGVAGEFLDLHTNIDLLDVDLCDAESSVIRQRIADHQAIPKDWLDPRIEQYISEHKLYA